MTNATDAKDGVPHKDSDRPSPDVKPGGPEAPDTLRETEGDGPATPGLRPEGANDLVSPAGVNERDPQQTQRERDEQTRRAQERAGLGSGSTDHTP